MRKVKAGLLCGLLVVVSSVDALSQSVTLPSGTAFRVKLSHRVRIRRGALVRGYLTQPVYLIDHEVIPAGAAISGGIRSTHPEARKEHIRRLLAADFTPPRVPNIVFDSLTIPAQGQRPAATIAIDAPAEETTARVLKLGVAAKKRSLLGQAEDAIRQKKESVESTLKDHNYMEIVEKWAVGQLPYHPLIVWSNERFDADLADPVAIPDTPHAHLPVEDLQGRLPQGVLHARLLTSLSSATAKRGNPVVAVISQPMLSPGGSSLVVPEGTKIYGKVVQVKAACRFGRNGSLRFSFSRLDLPTAEKRQNLEIHGQISAAETMPGEHVSVDDEGQAQANNGPGKYAEPLLLTVLAASAAPDDDHPAASEDVGSSTTASNGFGLIARVVSLSTRNTSVVEGFAFYALGKSLYYNFIAKGHDATFPHDTEVQVTLSER